MATIEIYYEIIFKQINQNKNEYSEEYNIDSLKKINIEKTINRNMEDEPIYHITIIEESGQLTKKKIEEILLDEKMDKNYMSSSFFEYSFKKKGEKWDDILKEFNQPIKDLKKYPSYELYLLITVDKDKYLKIKQNEEQEKEKEEKKEIVAMKQLTEELNEIQRKIKPLRGPKDDQGDLKLEKYYNAIINRKFPFYIMENKNKMETEDKIELNKSKNFTVIVSRDSNSLKLN